MISHTRRFSRLRRLSVLATTAAAGGGLGLAVLTPVALAAPGESGASVSVESVADQDGLTVLADGTKVWVDSFDSETDSGTDSDGPAEKPATSEEFGSEAKTGSGGANTQTLTTAQVLTLHSKPDADRVIYLDYDGATITDSYWLGLGVPSSVPAWDPAGNGAAFNAEERDAIEQGWATVSEFFSVWDVDVTTEDPGVAGLTRDGLNDATYGTRVIFAADGSATHQAVCAQTCAGVAGGELGTAGGLPTAWIFNASLLSATGATVHEVGHTLGLSHDGLAEPYSEYFAGQGNWAPVMGNGGNPVTQWSKGEYPNASNHEDDIAIIGAHLDVLGDDAPTSALSPAALPGGKAFISSDSDVDSYLLGTCSAGATATVTPSSNASTLDVEATLVRQGDSAAITTVNPPTYSQAGMAATVTIAQAGSGYVVEVRGGGGPTGWDDDGYGSYGSVGSYTVSTQGCTAASPSGAPGKPTGLVTTPDATDAAVDLSWSPPSGAVSGYVVSVDDREFTTTATHLAIDDLAFASTYTVRISAFNANGYGLAAVATATTVHGPPTAPVALKATPYTQPALAGYGTLTWGKRSHSGGAPVSGYKIYRTPVGGGTPTMLDTVGFETGYYTWSPQPDGIYVFSVTAVNSLGESAAVNSEPVSFGAVAPPAPSNVQAEGYDGSAAVTWKAPLGSVTSYTVTASPGGASTTVDASSTSATVTGLVDGEDYTLTVAATNDHGTSEPSAPSADVTAGRAPTTTSNVVGHAVDAPIQVTITAEDDSDEPSQITTRYTIGTESSPAADPRTAGTVYSPDDKPVLTTGQYVRYSSQDSSGNVEAPQTSATSRVVARLLSTPTLTATSNKVGTTVSVRPITASPAGAELSYQWRRRASASEAWVNIGSASASASYVLTAADVGAQISVKVTASAAGVESAWSSSGASVAVVKASAAGTNEFGGPMTGQFGTGGDGDGELNFPSGIAVDKAGFVYVTDQFNSRVQKFTASGDWVSTWKYPVSAKATDGGNYGTNDAVTVGPDGHVYVLDFNGAKVIEFDADGTVVKRWSTGNTYASIGIAVDDAGNVYTSTPSGVTKFDNAGTRLAHWGTFNYGANVGELEFYYAGPLALQGTTLYVADTGNNRIQAIDTETGEFLGLWNGESTGGSAFKFPSGLSVDDDGNFYVLSGVSTGANSIRTVIQKFDPTFAFVAEMWGGDPACYHCNMTVGANQQIYIGTQTDNVIGMVPARVAVPGAPTGAWAYTGDNYGEAVVWWSRPASNGVGLTGFKVVASPGGRSATVDQYQSTAVVTGLTPGKTYTFTVTALSNNGPSAPSEPTAALLLGMRSKAASLLAPKKAVTFSTTAPKVGKKVSVKKITSKTAGAKVKYQWLLKGKPVKGATGSSYKPQKKDRKKALALKVIITKKGYNKFVKVYKVGTVK